MTFSYTETNFVVDESGKTIALPRRTSDAALSPCHVDRSKLSALERPGNSAAIGASRPSSIRGMSKPDVIAVLASMINSGFLLGPLLVAHVNPGGEKLFLAIFRF